MQTHMRVSFYLINKWWWLYVNFAFCTFRVWLDQHMLRLDNDTWTFTSINIGKRRINKNLLILSCIFFYRICSLRHSIQSSLFNQRDKLHIIEKVKKDHLILEIWIETTKRSRKKMCWDTVYLCEGCGGQWRSINSNRGEREFCRCCNKLNSPHQEVCTVKFFSSSFFIWIFFGCVWVKVTTNLLSVKSIKSMTVSNCLMFKHQIFLVFTPLNEIFRLKWC